MELTIAPSIKTDPKGQIHCSLGEAYWRAGGDAQVALIGPGVDASHHYERTHRDALENTARLIAAYLLS